jgi:hypothetical protein
MHREHARRSWRSFVRSPTDAPRSRSGTGCAFPGRANSDYSPA